MVTKSVRHAREIQLPEAADLIDAYSQLRDFKTAKDEVFRLKEESESRDRPDILLIGALTTSCITRYCRPFAKGVRNHKNFQAALEDLDDNDRESHEHLLAWRNKHIAHSVNGFESNYLYAEWSDEPLSPATIGAVDVAEARVVGLKSNDIKSLTRLCEHFVNSLEKFIATESTRVLELARRAPQSVVLLEGNPERVFPEKSKIGTTRKRG